MICCLDVHYDEDEGVTAAVLFRDWASERPVQTTISRRSSIEPYQSGKFYRRELPCLLQALETLATPPKLILIDGYVWLDQHKPGLGAHLHQALAGSVSVIGVAKSAWPGSTSSRTIRRGNAARELWITAVGIDLEEAARNVAAMHGPFRLPTMIKLADTLCRRPWLAS
jgi:deoxyribonuclease V